MSIHRYDVFLVPLMINCSPSLGTESIPSKAKGETTVWLSVIQSTIASLFEWRLPFTWAVVQ